VSGYASQVVNAERFHVQRIESNRRNILTELSPISQGSNAWSQVRRDAIWDATFVRYPILFITDLRYPGPLTYRYLGNCKFDSYVGRRIALSGIRRQRVPFVEAKQPMEAREAQVWLTESGRKYKLQVVVTDPEGQEVLNLTKLAFEGEHQNGGYPTPDIGEALQLLVDAAGEWSAKIFVILRKLLA